MLEAYKNFWKGYVDFKGRSTRSDYWWTVLCHVIVYFVLGILTGIAGGRNSGGLAALFGTLALIYSFAIIVPSLALEVRRLRDANFHWAFIFFNLLAGIVVFILNQFPTKDGEYNGN